MTTVYCEIWEEKTLDQKRSLVKLITETVAEALGEPLEEIKVKIDTYARDEVAKGGVLVSDV